MASFSRPPCGQPIRGLLFDKDGTLFDFRLTWGRWCAGFIRDLAKGDESAAEALSGKLGYDLVREEFAPTSPVIAGTMDVVVHAIKSCFPELSREAIRAHVLASTSEVPQVEAVPLPALMARLKGDGHTLGIATNDAEQAARHHLDSSGILEDFSFIAGYDSGFGAKPDPGMLLAFCDHSNFEPADCVMIGDSTHDLLSGRAAGMRTVGVLTGLAEAEELADLADVILPSIGALPGWIEGENRTVAAV